MRLITAEVIGNTQRKAFHGADLHIMRLLRQLKTYAIELVCEHELEALLGSQLPLTVEF